MQILVTGAGRGIGLELARAYGGRGDSVVATARDPEKADALRALAADAHGKVRVERLDVTSDESCLALARALGDSKIDLLLNNAGIGGRYVGLAEVDMKEALRVYDTNALGPVRVTRALLPNLRRARGKIASITSLMGSIDDNRSGNAYAYRMSKAALNMASKNFALEFAGAGIVSVVVNPGWVKTDMGGPSAPLAAADAAAKIVALLDRVGPADTGMFFNGPDGRELPW